MEKPEFRAKLIEVRKAKGLTQEEVADECGITVRTIQRIESGIVKPRAFTAKIISDTLGFEFFDNSNTGNDVIMNQETELKKHNYLWYLTDLFNLKTKTMKKLSILSMTTLIVLSSIFAYNSKTYSQTQNTKNSITVKRDSDMSIRRIEVRFTNNLTFDSLTTIKNDLEALEIKINYKRIEFDDNNRLKWIALNAYTDLGIGSFSMNLSDPSTTGGFFLDYSKDAKTKFCIGGCDL